MICPYFEDDHCMKDHRQCCLPRKDYCAKLNMQIEEQSLIIEKAKRAFKEIILMNGIMGCETLDLSVQTLEEIKELEA